MMRYLVVLLSCLCAVAATDVTGTWDVTATGPDGAEHKLGLELKGAPDKLIGSMSSPEGTVEIEDVQLKGDQLSYKVPARGGYVIRFTVSGNSMKGTFTGADGATGPMQASRANAAAASPNVAGKWKGTAKSNNGRQYDIELELAIQGGKITGTLSAAEGSVQVQGAKLEGNQLSFKLATDEGEYSAKLTVSGNEMKGTYTAPGGETGNMTVSR